METIPNVRSNFQKVYVSQDKVLDYLIHMGNRIADVLKSFRNKKSISTEQ